MDENRLPDFLIIGAAKGGTSSLYDMLCQHPHIYMPKDKEPCFFDDSVAWDKGLIWYSSLFRSAEGDQICGEASTNYTRWPQVEGVPEKIKHILPKIKLIYLMRDPAKRAYSHYVHRWLKETHRNQPFTLSFFEYIKQDPVCIDSSRYVEQIDQYLEYFSRDQLYLVTFESLLLDPIETLGGIYDFLGIENIEVAAFPSKNISREFRYHKSRKVFVSNYKNSIIYSILSSLLPLSIKEFLYDKLLIKLKSVDQIRKSFEPVPLNEMERTKLKEIFLVPNKELSSKYDVDISHWI